MQNAIPLVATSSIDVYSLSRKLRFRLFPNNMGSIPPPSRNAPRSNNGRRPSFFPQQQPPPPEEKDPLVQDKNKHS